MKKRIELSCGQGEDTFFLIKEGREDKVLSYEFDFDRIHELGGGKSYYTSMSGLSRKGYVENLNGLIPVGSYRVDTKYNDWQFPKEIIEGIKVMIPYKSHEHDRFDTLNSYPVVITTENKIIYCGFYTTMKDVLRTLTCGEEFEEPPIVISKTFVNVQTKQKEQIEFEFYNFFRYSSFVPLEFKKNVLKQCRLTKENSEKSVNRLYQILGIRRLKDGSFVRTYRVGCSMYATEVFGENPTINLDTPEKVIKGWEFGTTNVLYKFRKDHVYIVGWDFKEDGTQICIEKEVSRLFFVFNKEYCMNNIREDLENKLKE